MSTLGAEKVWGTSTPGRWWRVPCQVPRVQDSCPSLPHMGSLRVWGLKGNPGGRGVERRWQPGETCQGLLLTTVGTAINYTTIKLAAARAETLIWHLLRVPPRSCLVLISRRFSSILCVPSVLSLRLSTLRPRGSPVWKSEVGNLPLPSPAKLGNPRASKDRTQAVMRWDRHVPWGANVGWCLEDGGVPSIWSRPTSGPWKLACTGGLWNIPGSASLPPALTATHRSTQSLLVPWGEEIAGDCSEGEEVTLEWPRSQSTPKLFLLSNKIQQMEGIKAIKTTGSCVKKSPQKSDRSGRHLSAFKRSSGLKSDWEFRM